MREERIDGVWQCGPPVAEHGEGPVWDSDAGLIRWVDMLAGDILCAPAGRGAEVTRRHVAEVAAAMRPRAAGGLVLAVERGFALLDPGQETVRALPQLWSDARVRMNDGACDPQGRFYCGSMAYDEVAGAGALYRLDPDGSTERVLADVTISNGLAWAPTGDTAYYVDTPTQRIDAFDFDPASGRFHGRRPVVHIPEAAGSPDGLTVDAEGHLWVALWCGGAVRRYSPTGELEEHVPVPVRHVTACTFGGPRLDTLYITTSRVDLTDGEAPYAGALFGYRPGVRGLAAGRFAG